MKIKQFKKGDLSINMIIVAALAIVVLLVVAMIFTGKLRVFGRTMQSCGSLGGKCVDSTSASAGIFKQKEDCRLDMGGDVDNFIVHSNTDCSADDKQFICCQKII